MSVFYCCQTARQLTKELCKLQAAVGHSLIGAQDRKLKYRLNKSGLFLEEPRAKSVKRIYGMLGGASKKKGRLGVGN